MIWSLSGAMSRSIYSVVCPIVVGSCLLGAALIGCQRQDDKPLTVKPGGPLPNPQGVSGDPALSAAARAGNLDEVRRLVEGGGDVNTRGPNAVTPLIAAAAAGQAQVVQYLLEHGADANLRDGKGQTARQHAEAGGHNDLARALQEAEVRPPVGPAKPIPAPR